MPNKPSFELILDTYSQEELAGLYKEKVLRDSQEHIEAFKKHLSNLNELFQGGTFADTTSTPAAKKRGPKPKTAQVGEENGTTGKRRGRPAKIKAETGSESGAAEENGAEKGSKQALGSLILSVLKKKPMKIEEILEQVHEKGWATKSNQPRTLISQELAKQLKKGAIEKAERGSYKKA